MENNGWIKLHRKMLDNPLCQKPHYAWIWIYLLLICNHEDQQFIWNGEKRTVKRGEVITGRINISQNTGVPETTVERILNYLEKDGQIGQQKTNKFRLITIKNYDRYQEVRTTNGQQADNKRTQTRMNKNDKNDKNILQATACDVEEIIYEPVEEDRKTINKQIFALMSKFKEYNPGIRIEHKTQRKHCEELINQFGYEKALNTVKFVLQIQGKEFAPTITTPTQLINKIGDLKTYCQRLKNQQSPQIVKI